MLTTQDKQEVRQIVRDETADLRQEAKQHTVDIRRIFVLLESIDGKISAIAENVSSAGRHNIQLRDHEERIELIEKVTGLSKSRS